MKCNETIETYEIKPTDSEVQNDLQFTHELPGSPIGVHETKISPFTNRFMNCQTLMTSLVQKVQQTVKQNLKMEKDL